MSFLGSLFKGAMDFAAREIDIEAGLYAPGRGREYDYTEVDQIPREMGTYRVLGKAGSGRKILYIGISKDLRRRVMEHKNKGENLKYGEVVAIKIANSGTTYEKIREHERIKIVIHQPERNKRAGGGGRSPEFKLDED